MRFLNLGIGSPCNGKTAMLMENQNLPIDSPLEYSLFLGCVVPNRYPMYEKATRVVMEKLKIILKDMEGASCCPAPGVFRSVDNKIWTLIGARNLTIAEKNNADIVTLCNGCYGTLSDVNHILKSNPQITRETNEDLSKINRHYNGTIAVKHLMEVLYKDIGLSRIKSVITTPLKLNVAVHYGCHC